MSYQDRFARIVSMLLVPPVISALTFGLLAAAYQHGSLVHRLLVWIVAMLCSGGIQIVYVLSLRRKLKVTDYDVPVQAQRTKPYMISACVSLAGILALWYLNASIAILSLMICHFMGTLLVAAVNLRWKISAHAFGFFGPLPALAPLLGAGILLAFPAGILLGWARVRLHAHTVAQVAAGAIAGFLFTAVQLFLIYTYVFGTGPF